MRPVSMLLLRFILIAGSLLFTAQADAQETVCAVVKIEIRQELTLERQAFEARMRITNGLDTLALEGVDINVTFEDVAGNPVLASSNPNDTNARFFIRLDTMDGIADVSGSGVIPPKGVAEITWLIIPAQGTGGSGAQGVLYAVGASLDYRFGGESEQVIVAPDVIRVRPMPLLTLDYFLPANVFGDDPMTPEQEDAEPFDLGVRVSNTGAGLAKALRIESAQPRIVENQQGLLVDFSLLGSSVNDAPVQSTLLADFGDIAAGTSKVARWVMTSSLSGTFLSFEAEYVHKDALGGALTSLLDEVRTHTLVRNVRVDLPGRDAVRDFLALDGAVLRVYESDGGESVVSDLSASAALQREPDVQGRPRYRLTLPSSEGLRFARVADPNPSVSGEYSAWRLDGKQIDAANVWRFRELDGAGHHTHWIGIFDTAGPGQFELRFSDAVSGNLPPQLSVPTSIQVEAGALLSVPVEATDPEGQPVSVSLVVAPDGMTISQLAANQWRIDWTPTTGQVGAHSARLRASDGQAAVDVDLQIQVQPPASLDSDGDGLNDDWEREHFGDLSRDGSGDFDQDGATDRAEHDHGGDPTFEDRPGRVAILTPVDSAVVETLPTDFAFENAQRALDAELQYRLELIDPADPYAPQLIANAAEQPIETVLSLAPVIHTGRPYIWRVGAHDGATPGDWSYGRFVFGSLDSAPRCSGAFPVADGRPGDLQPRLSVRFSQPTAEKIVFEVATDDAFATLLAQSGSIGWQASVERAWRPAVALPTGVPLYWRALRLAGDASEPTACSSGMFEIAEQEPPQGYSISAHEAVEGTDEVRLTISGGETGAPGWRYDVQIDSSPDFASPDQRSTQVDADAEADAEATFIGLPRGVDLWSRVRASSDQADGMWVYQQFQLSPAADELAAPLPLRPRDGTWVATRWPSLEAMLAEGLAATFRFQVFADASLNELVAEMASPRGHAEMPAPLDDRQRYWWRVRAEIGPEVHGPWSDAQSFFTIDAGVNQAPEFAWASLLVDTEARPGAVELRWSLADPDSAASVDLFYEDVDSGESGTIADGLSEQHAGQLEWPATGLEGRTLRIGARVSDGQHESVHYAPGMLRVIATGLDLEPISLMTSESGDAAEVLVTLRAAPRDLVRIPLSVSDASEAAVEPVQLEFSPDNWQVAQTVRLTGVDDDESDGNQAFSLLWGPVVSEDEGYAGLAGALPGFSNVDDDTASILLTSDSLPLITSEEGGSAVLYVRLGTRPTAPVTLTLATDEPGEVALSPATLTLTPETWSQAQAVQVIGLDDDVVDGDRSFVVAVVEVQSDDPAYANADLPQVDGINLDDERVALIVSPATPLVLHAGGSGATLHVSLNARPEAAVEVLTTVSPDGVAVVAPVALSFDASNWNQPVALDVTAEVVTEAHNFEIRFDTSGSEDPRFAAADAVLLQGTVLPAPSAAGFEIGRAAQAVWQIGEVVRVPLSGVFAGAPVVATTWVSASDTPAIARVVATDPDWFDVVVLRGAPSGEPSVSGTLNFIAVEPGQHVLPDGRRIYAMATEISAAQGVPQASWATVQFPHAFDVAPVVLVGLQSRHNASWLTPALSGVNTNSVQVALDAGGSGMSPAHPESLGLIAMEAGVMSSSQAGAEVFEYETRRLANRVSGIDAGCTNVAHASSRPQPPLILASKADRQGTSGGWVKVCSESDSFAALAIDEDLFADQQRGQQAASVSLLAASKPFAAQLESSRPALVLDQHLGLRTFGDGHGVGFAVRLSAAPDAPVSVPISAPTAEAHILPTVLQFGPENWNVPQWVRVKAPNVGGSASIELSVHAGPSLSSDARFDALHAPPATIVVHPSGSWARVLDNEDAGFSAVGNWATSRAVKGYYGSNYLAHAANGESPDALVIDNSDPGFSATGTWTASTSVGGFWGANYLYRLRGEPQEAALVDDPAAQFEGEWSQSTAVGGYHGAGYRAAPAGDGSRRATWKLTGLPSGDYRVLVRWTAHANRADNAPYSITHRNGTETLRVNQRQDGARWVELGVYALDGNSEVALSNASNGYVIADAVKVISTSAPPNAAVWQTPIPAAGDYEVFARWTAHANRATNAIYSVEHAEGRTDVEVNQAQSGATWVSLGTYSFTSAAPARVSLSDQADGYVIADAVRFVPTSGRANEAEWRFVDLPLGEFTLAARWTAHANRASNARYLIRGLLGDQIAIANQRIRGGTWSALATATSAPERPLAVVLNDRADGYVIADALRIEDQAMAGPRGSRLVDDVMGEVEGVWSTSTSVTGFFGSGYRAAPAGSGSARFTWPLPVAADSYRVYARWTHGSNRAGNASYRVVHAFGEATVQVNQKERGAQWVLLGEFQLDGQSKVMLDDTADGYVIADAIRIEPARYPEVEQ